MSLELAQDLQQRALAAESAEDAVRLAAAFHRVARGLRQTLALELKVIRYKDEAARETQQAAGLAETARRAEADAHDQAVEQRADAVRARVGDTFWSEHEPPDWRITETGRELPLRPPEGDPIWDRLDAFLDEARTREDFLTRDVHRLVIEACDAIGADPTLIYAIPGRRPAETTAEPAAADSS
ncbi:hypothetical protein [Phenylobacterium sp.]|uniref:hypothetical protein n=1 Tax=Phenylobacterium sp. TaxID=1871053 RepID=UPI0035B42F31